MTTQTESLGSPAMTRIAALVLAVLMAVGAYYFWQKTASVRQDAQSILQPGELRALGTSDAVTSCKEQRFAEIDRALREGTLSADDAGRARENAVNLCIMQNRDPGL